MHRERRGSREAPARAPASASRQANAPTPGALACLGRRPPENGQNSLGGRVSGRAVQSSWLGRSLAPEFESSFFRQKLLVKTRVTAVVYK